VNRAAKAACSSSTIAAQYEVLRAAALGEALPLMARSGLVLFLRRGMWGWARALTAAATSPQEPVNRPLAVWPTQGGRSAVVHVLAEIATSINDTGISERRAP
jgi:hypothetical protein